VLVGAAGTGVTRFAKRGFIERIRRQDFLQILKAVEQKIYEIDSRYHPARGDPLARAEGSVQYAVFLKGVAFYLKSGKRPASLSGAEFQLLRPLVASLVRHGQLRAAALDAFDR
jgi:hypothetical protein